MVRLAELIVILELHQQGMTVSAIARRTGLHRSTVARYIARGIEPPIYGPRPPRPTKLAPFERYLRERIAAVPELTGSRLYREIRELGYRGGYTVVKDFLRQVRPRAAAGFEVRFETPPGYQAQVDFAHFRTVFTDAPGAECGSASKGDPLLFDAILLIKLDFLPFGSMKHRLSILTLPRSVHPVALIEESCLPGLWCNPWPVVSSLTIERGEGRHDGEVPGFGGAVRGAALRP